MPSLPSPVFNSEPLTLYCDDVTIFFQSVELYKTVMLLSQTVKGFAGALLNRHCTHFLSSYRHLHKTSISENKKRPTHKRA